MGQPKDTTFALFFGNRGFFPAKHVNGARVELPKALADLGYTSIMMDEDKTRYGGIETPAEARAFADFLKKNRGAYDGVLLSLPNFGDENAAAIALKDAGVPIFVQAYPDDMDKMSPANRRDSFCGKLSIMDVLGQHKIKFTISPPHVVKPGSDAFRENIDYFASVCRIVGGIKGMTAGAVGARTTPFKTVRIDELTLQRHDITVETFDLSDLFARMKSVDQFSDAYKSKGEHLQDSASLADVPASALDSIIRLGVALDDLIEENGLDAISIRCWTEIQQEFGISPCLITADLMEKGIPGACEVDTGSAVAMHALGLASQNPTMILDWNNNYGDDEDKCILFHCGNVAPSLMVEGTSRVADHAILKSTVGEGRGYGCNQGRIAPGDYTFNNLLTENGDIKMYVGEGRITPDEIPGEFFGCAGVAEIPNLQRVLTYIGESGHRHHVAMTPGRVQTSMREALEKYLGFQVDVPQAM